ncbi:MAG TPA: glycosyltransferase 87 family protein [Candidatus Limnocylindrales bacterium]|nr:glycosyltransferase 87 family protein [Candidatus Limnocylindrales bacterium]
MKARADVLPARAGGVVAGSFAALDRLAAAPAFRVVVAVAPRALTVVGVAFGLLLMTGMQLRTDAQLYHSIGLDRPYGGLVGEDGAFLYSPAFAQALQPFRVLPVEAFVTGWRLVELALLAWLAGPFTLPLLLTIPVTAELMEAQVHLIMGAAIVGAWRWPGLWAIPILTKPTTGVALLFHAGRRDWRTLRIALAWTTLVTSVSLLVAPGLWVAWVEVLVGSTGRELSGPVIQVPLALRLPAAALLAWYAGRRDWPRLVPIAATIALPALWVVGLSMAVAAFADVRGLRRQEGRAVAAT